ncbi:MAG: SDR family oxidoreductase [Pseudomonadales bacterium]|nr:SDR family oxidoreductase [Pseudomonadales bacterium]
MTTVVITGANRGIGLSFAKLYQSKSSPSNNVTVYALCRSASEELKQLGVNVVEGIDVSSADVAEHIQAALKGVAIDVLINNAGILRNEVLGDIDYASIQSQFETNALGPLRVAEALVPQMNAGAKIAMMTSRMGSITDNTSGGRYGYRMSKAALNIAAVSLAQDVAASNIAVAILHPGLVGTEMIGGHGDITPDQAAQRLMTRIDALTLQNSGTFWHSNGEQLPW